MLWNTPEVKQLNSERVRREIQRNPKCTKAQVARATELSVATCNTIFNELLASGEIRVVDQEEAAMGRPAIRFEYNEDDHHVLGVIVSLIDNAETIDYIVGNALGETIKQGQVSCKAIDYKQIEQVIADCIAEDDLIRGITIGIPGVTANGIVERCDIDGIVGEPLEKKLEKKFGIDVMVRNDMDIMSYGVYQSDFEKQGDLCAVFFPPKGIAYVGAGMIIDGKILTGATQFSGEIRYIAEAFGMTTEQMKKDSKNEKKLTEFAVKMLVILISTIDPEKIVVMGDCFEEKDALKLRNGCAQIVGESHVPSVEIVREVLDKYTCGLIRLALNHRDFPLLESI